MMKIVVNDIAATPTTGGTFTILKNFYTDICNNDKTNHWIFFLSGKYFKETKNVRIIVRPDLKKSKIKKALFELVYGHYFINRLNPDVYLSLQNIATCGIKAKHQIVYLHQVIPFQHIKDFSFFKSEERTLAFYQKVVGWVIKYSLRRQKPYVIVQTASTKHDLVREKLIDNSKILIHSPVVPGNMKNKIYHGSGRDFFYPASSYIYKNHDIIFKAVDYLKLKGITNFHVNLTIPPKENLNDFISFFGHIPYERVMEMYSDNVLIFPSYIESFGLPLIEAASRADIILAANTPFAHEILKSYTNVYYFNLNDYCKLAKLMNKVIKREIKSDGKNLIIPDNGSLFQFIINFLKVYY